MKFTASHAVSGLLCLSSMVDASPVQNKNKNGGAKRLVNMRGVGLQGRTQQMMRYFRDEEIRRTYDEHWRARAPGGYQCKTGSNNKQGSSTSYGATPVDGSESSGADSTEVPDPVDSDSPDPTATDDPSAPTVTDPADGQPNVPQEPAPSPYYIELPVEHSDPSKGTFRNRYFVNDTYYQVGGPIILFDGGESGLDGKDLQAPDDLNMKYAKEHNGLVIQWEHRYYGESVPECPFDIKNTTGVDPEVVGKFFTPLNLNNSLDDLAVFAKSFKWKVNGNETMDLSSGNVPWVMIGGSYPGDRVGYIQARHPGLFSFGLASSAPVGFKVEYWEYWVPVERAMAKYNMSGCANDIHNIADWLSKAYKAGDIKPLRTYSDTYHKAMGDDLVPSNATMKDLATDISNWHMTPMSIAQYFSIYSVPLLVGSAIGVKDFCGYFQGGINGTATETADPEKGYSASCKPEKVAKLYAQAVGDVYSKSPASTIASISSTDEFPYDGRSWTWQTCTELMSFVTGNSTRPTNLVPDFVSVEQTLEACKQAFGTAAYNLKEIHQRRDELEAQYGGWHLETGNIVWTNGEYDPWRFLGQTTDIAEDGGSKFANSTTEVPACGKKLPKGTQLSYIIKDGTHCSDLHPFDPSVDQRKLIPEERLTDAATGIKLTLQPPIMDIVGAQKLWEDAMRVWLKDGCEPAPDVITVAN